MSEQTTYSLDMLMPKVAKMEIINGAHWDPEKPLDRSQPYEGGTGIWLNLIGKDTKPYKDRARQLLKGQQGKSQDVLALINESNELTATCIVGWNEAGEAAFGPYSPTRALELVRMDELSPLVEQVQEFTSHRNHFFR